MPTLALLFNIVLGSPSPSNQTKKEKKEIQIRNEEVKLCQFTDDMILSTENPKYTTKTH